MARLSDRFKRIGAGTNGVAASGGPGIFGRNEVAAPTLADLPLDEIVPDPAQPRRDLGDLSGLRESIAAHGIVQPLIVSPAPPAPDGADRYTIIAGERRYSAAKALGLSTVPAVVRTVEEHRRLELQLVENLQRKDLTPLEEAESYRRLMDEYGLTQDDMARRLGRSKATINQTLRLLTLPADIRDEAARGAAMPPDVQTSEQDAADIAPLAVSKSVLLEIAKTPAPERQREMWEAAKAGTLTVRSARGGKRGASEAPNVQTSEQMSDEVAAVRSRRHEFTTAAGARIVVTLPAPGGTREDARAALDEAARASP